MVKDTIINVSQEVAIKHGVNPITFLLVCKNKPSVKFTENERKAIIDLLRYSVLTNAEMLEHHFGIKKEKMYTVINTISKNRSILFTECGMTQKHKDIYDFIGEHEKTTRQVVNRFKSRRFSDHNIKTTIIYMINKGFLRRVKRGVYVTNKI